LPGFHAIAVIVLKLVMEIVVALAEGEDGASESCPAQSSGSSRVGRRSSGKES
jgi:hypothetical protein